MFCVMDCYLRRIPHHPLTLSDSWLYSPLSHFLSQQHYKSIGRVTHLTSITQFVDFERTWDKKKEEIKSKGEFLTDAGALDAKCIDSTFASLKNLATERSSLQTNGEKLSRNQASNMFLDQKIAIACSSLVIFTESFTSVLAKRYTQAASNALTHSPLFKVPSNVKTDSAFFTKISYVAPLMLFVMIGYPFPPSPLPYFDCPIITGKH